MNFSSFYPKIQSHTFLKTFKNIFSVIFGSIVLIISAKIIIPIFPVNGTLQTLVLPIMGVFLGPEIASLSVGLYLLEGILGFPVFTGSPEKGLGLAYMMGPTAGFLLGFIPSVYIMGKLYEKNYCKNILLTIFSVTISCLFVIIPGIIWLSYLFGYDIAIASLIAFLPGTITKIGLASVLIYKFKN